MYRSQTGLRVLGDSIYRLHEIVGALRCATYSLQKVIGAYRVSTHQLQMVVGVSSMATEWPKKAIKDLTRMGSILVYYRPRIKEWNLAYCHSIPKSSLVV